MAAIYASSNKDKERLRPKMCFPRQTGSIYTFWLIKGEVEKLKFVNFIVIKYL